MRLRICGPRQRQALGSEFSRQWNALRQRTKLLPHHRLYNALCFKIINNKPIHSNFYKLFFMFSSETKSKIDFVEEVSAGKTCPPSCRKTVGLENSYKQVTSKTWKKCWRECWECTVDSSSDLCGETIESFAPEMCIEGMVASQSGSSFC